MLRLSLRTVLAHKFRFALTTLAVVMGVGFVVGSFVVTDSLRASVDQLFGDITGGVDVSVRQTSNLDSGQAPAARGRVPGELVEAVRAIDGVEVAEGAIGGYAQLVDLDGEPLTTTGAPFLGVSWGHEDALRPATLDVGRAPDGPGEVAIDRGTAQEIGFELGDRTTVLLADGTQPEVEIVGIFTFGESNNLLGARITAFDVDVASDVFATDGSVDSVDVAAAPGVDPQELADRIQAILPAGVESVTSTQVSAEFEDGVSGFLGAFQNILLGFAAVALFVSAFFINNTFSIVVGQRTRELALLRSIGAVPSQVTRSIVGEGLVVGVLASVIGIGFGLGIAAVLEQILSGFGLPDQGTVLQPRTWIAAAVVGIGVTLAASLSPARRASRIPPIEGMREGFVSATGSRTRKTIAGAALTAVGGTCVVLGLFVADETNSIVALLGGGAVAVFLGVAQLSPVVAVPLAGTIGRPVAPLFRMAGRLAHLNAVRNPDRTAKTASALMIGLALVTTVFVVGTSMKATFAASVERSVSADYILSSPGFVGFSPAVTEAVGALPEIEAVTGVRLGRFIVEGNERDVVAVDPAAAARVIDIGLVSGAIETLDESGILLHEDPATDLGLAVGDAVTVAFATGDPVELTVAGVYDDATYAGNYLIDLDLFAAEYPTSNLDMFAFARLADGVDPAAADAALATVLADQPQVELDDRAGFQADQQAQFDSLLVAINGLLGLALFIALLGIANTLALSVLERTREIGLLRAVGMLRRQAREMVLLESAMVSAFGAFLGVAVGLLFGIAAASAMPESVITTIAIPYGTVLAIVLVAAACGIAAGVLPARRAARLDILRAISSE